MAPSDDLDRLIEQWRNGDKEAERALFELLYQRLHAIAVRIRAQQGAAMQATSLVHEAFLRMRRSQKLAVNDTSHFLHLVARVMKHVLTDRARECKAACNGGGMVQVEWKDALVSTEAQADEILDIEYALRELAERYPRQAKLVEYTYFAGYTTEEAAALIGYSSRQARRDLEIARPRLGKIIDGRNRGSDKE